MDGRRDDSSNDEEKNDEDIVDPVTERVIRRGMDTILSCGRVRFQNEKC